MTAPVETISLVLTAWAIQNSVDIRRLLAQPVPALSAMPDVYAETAALVGCDPLGVSS